MFKKKKKNKSEVLFRGKRVDNGEWVYGNYANTDCYTECNDYIFQNKPLEHGVVPETVGQYTGLDDRNGRKIFEGDIIKAYHNGEVLNISYVYFDNGEYQCELISGCFIDLFENLSGQHEECSLEIIGNVHDNNLEKKENEDT